ncbi:unnamed protein product [Notodromas monacha]|uniref:Uncharacterized protein n=1 Tax=Notodromas monacha TaxID=399045 RepID=A0A7R9BE38_9CRUS|nr:unnamed protein product [Notodromas monacha]CAG0912764.1 unnamed protein product [Notodromas monacha]
MSFGIIMLTFVLPQSFVRGVECQGNQQTAEVFPPRDRLEACVKLCVSVDPSNGRVTFTGGNTDCLDACKKKYLFSSPMSGVLGQEEFVGTTTTQSDPTSQSAVLPLLEREPGISTIYSTLMRGWTVLEDLCEIFDRARTSGLPGVSGMSDKHIMCDVLEGINQPNFNKAVCLVSNDAEDLIRGCKQMTLAKMAHSRDEMVVKMANELNKEVANIKAKHEFSQQHHQQDHMNFDPAPSMFYQAPESASQRLEHCVNADFLRKQELDTIQALRKEIAVKQNLVRQLERKPGCGAVDGAPEIPAEPRASPDGMTRMSCAQDLGLLRFTMNKILDTLEQKYEDLSLRKCDSPGVSQVSLNDPNGSTDVAYAEALLPSPPPHDRLFAEVLSENITHGTMNYQTQNVTINAENFKDNPLSDSVIRGRVEYHGMKRTVKWSLSRHVL